MLRQTIAIRMLNTGDVKQIEAKTARLLVACKKAIYAEPSFDEVGEDVIAAALDTDTRGQSYADPQPPAKRRGRPPKAKSEE